MSIPKNIPPISRNMLALAHHWLVGMRGGEKVLEQFLRIFPEAPIYTLVKNNKRITPELQQKKIITSFLQNIPHSHKLYQKLLPLFPLALSNLKVVRETSFVLSSDASVIKGIHIPEYVPHVCYCHSPPRYLWDLTDIYASKGKGLGTLGKLAFRATVPYVRQFDLRAAQRVSSFIANSKFVQKRIADFYRRDSIVIHPPVDVDKFSPDKKSEDFYLIVSEITPYKRIDLAVEAFRKNKRKLIIIGDGPLRNQFEQSATPNIVFKGRLPDDEVRQHFETCRAFIFPQIEDFGITAVEAQAAGKPVIAFHEGGAVESVLDGQTGLFFDQQTSESLEECIQRFENEPHDKWKTPCRNNSLSYRNDIFRNKITSYLVDHYPDQMKILLPQAR